MPPQGASDTATGCVSSGPSLLSILATIIIAAAPLLVATYLYRAAGQQAQPA